MYSNEINFHAADLLEVEFLHGFLFNKAKFYFCRFIFVNQKFCKHLLLGFTINCNVHWHLGIESDSDIEDE